MKNKTFMNSVRCAFEGLTQAFNKEKNFKVYILIAIIFMLINICININKAWWIGYITTACGVFATELLNTAIERLADAVTLDIRDDIKEVKDIAASGVLLWGFGFFLVEIIAITEAILILR